MAALRLRIATVVGLSAAVLLAGCSGSTEKAPSTTPASTSASPSSASIGSPTSTASTSLSPVAKVLDRTAVQDGVRRVLEESYQVPSVDDVSCPANQQVIVDATFDCTATIKGADKTVTITVKTPEGQYEVGQPK